MLALKRRRQSPPARTILERKRARMIHDTNVFLSLALRSRGEMPRIPVTRADEGGYSRLLRIPGAREMICQFWNRILGE